MDFNDIVDSISIKPYYLDREAGQVIYCADCRDILPLIPDKSIDLVLTDPPYGVGIDFGIYQDTPQNWRDLMLWSIPELNRISQCVIMPCSRIVELPFIYANFKAIGYFVGISELRHKGHMWVSMIGSLTWFMAK